MFRDAPVPKPCIDKHAFRKEGLSDMLAIACLVAAFKFPLRAVFEGLDESLVCARV